MVERRVDGRKVIKEIGFAITKYGERGRLNSKTVESSRVDTKTRCRNDKRRIKRT